MYAIVGWMSEFYSTKTYQKKLLDQIYIIFFEGLCINILFFYFYFI